MHRNLSLGWHAFNYSFEKHYKGFKILFQPKITFFSFSREFKDQKVVKLISNKFYPFIDWKMKEFKI